MADNRLVHNTTPYALVVSGNGVRVLGNSSQEIDITESRAQMYLASGDLILTGTPDPVPAPEPTKATASKRDGKPDPNTSNGE